MIEQIARASHKFFRPIYKLPPFEDLPDDAKSVMFQHAAAILTGIRAPTDGMIEAAYDESNAVDCSWAWQSMIDKAISEKP